MGFEWALNTKRKLGEILRAIATTVINVASFTGELFYTPNRMKRSRSRGTKRDLLIVLDMRMESAKYYGKIYAELKNKGKMAKDRIY